MLSIQNISPPSLSEDNDQQGMFPFNNSDSFADCEDVTPTQIVPHENSVNVDNVVTDCDDTKVITNKPPQNELIQVDIMTTQISNFKNKQPFEDKPNKNGVSEDMPQKLKENEGTLLNNTHVKKNFDEVVDQFKRALQSPTINVKSGIQNDPNEIITSDKANESESIDVDYNNAPQDNKGQGQREESKDSLVVSSNTDDKVVQCPVDGNITNNIKDENKIKYCGRGLPSQEQMDVLNESANVTTLTNVSDLTDEESSPKRSKQFTFLDSDLPNDDEIKEILKMYPKPTFIESFSESESESSLEDESNRPMCRRRRNKPEPVDLTKMLERLPVKVLTRLREQPDRLGIENIKKNSAILKPTYLTVQENEIDEDIIAENIRRLKVFGKRKQNTDTQRTNKQTKNKDSRKQKSVKEEKKRSLRKKAVNKSNGHKKNIKVKPKIKNAKSKSKSNARKSAELKIKNTKDSLVSMSAAKTTTTRTRSMKNEKDGKDAQIKRILQIKNTKGSLVSISAAKTTTTKTRSMKNENDGKDAQNKRILQIKNTKGSLFSISAAKTTITRTRSMKNENDGKDTQNKRTLQIKNTKGSLVSISAAKTTTTRIRSMKNENDGKNTQNKRMLQIKNTKDKQVSISAAKTTTKRTRSMKNENDGKDTRNKRILQENRNNITNCKQKLTNMKERSRLAENKVRRSKRQPKAKQKNKGTMKAPISILKKTIHEQNTVYNISPFSSESPKGLKRSLVDKSDVPSLKRTRYQNRINNQEFNNNNSRVKKTQHGNLSVIHNKELQRDKREKYELEPQKRIRMPSNRNSLNMKTRTQSARRRSQRACQRTGDGGARR